MSAIARVAIESSGFDNVNVTCFVRRPISICETAMIKFQQSNVLQHSLPYVAAVSACLTIGYFNLFHREAELWFRWQSIFMAASVGLCLTLITKEGSVHKDQPKHLFIGVPLACTLLVIVCEITSAKTEFGADALEALGRMAFFAPILLMGIFAPWFGTVERDRETIVGHIAHTLITGLIVGAVFTFILKQLLTFAGLSDLKPIDVLRIHPVAVITLCALWIGAAHIFSNQSSQVSRSMGRIFDFFLVFFAFAYVIIFLTTRGDRFGGELGPTLFIYLTVISAPYLAAKFKHLIGKAFLTIFGSIVSSLALAWGARLDNHPEGIVGLVCGATFLMVIIAAWLGFVTTKAIDRTKLNAL